MPDQPNILIIWGDDIGQSNLSCYSHGVMGYRTPNIDRIAAEGALFTDYYGEQSLHGRPGGVHHRSEPVPHRSDEGRDAGLSDRAAGEDPTIATALKAHGLRDGTVRQEPLR